MSYSAASPPKPAPGPPNQAGSPLPDQSANPYAQYNIQTAPADYSTWRAPLTQWLTDIIVALDDAAELREPTTPYVEILGPDGKNGVVQWIDTTIRNYGDSLSAFIRAEEVRVRAPEADNPAATAEDRAAAEAAIRFDMQYQDEVLSGDAMQERKDLLTYRGMYFAQHVPLSDDESAELDGLKVRSDLLDLFNVSWQMGVGNRLDRVITQQRRLVSELPPSWQTMANLDDPTQDIVVYEYFDRFQHGVVAADQIAKALTPHGYLDMNGRPAVPITVVMHNPRTVRQGRIGPQPSGVSQRGIRVGVPIMFSLLTEHIKRSRALTLAMHAARTGSVPMIAVKGLMDSREAGDGEIDFESGVIELEDTASSDVRFVTPADASPSLKLIIDSINQDLAAASTAPGIMQGQVTQNVPGVSSNSMTSWARAKAESLALTLGKGLTAEAGMKIGIYKQILVAPTARQYQRAAGEPLSPHTGAQSPLMNDGITMPVGGGVQVDDLTFADIRRIVVEVVADNRMPLEQEMQLAVTLAGVKTASGQPLVSDRYIREHLLHMANPIQAEHDALLQTLAANPQTPFGRVAILKAMLANMRVELSDPAKADSYDKQLSSLTDMALASAFQEAQQELQQSMQQSAQGGGAPTGGPPPPGAPPGPPGQPPGGPPPGGPPPGPPPPPMGGGIPMMLHPAPPQGPPPGPPMGGPPPMTNFPPPPGQQPGPMPMRPPGVAPSPLIASGPISAPQGP